MGQNTQIALVLSSARGIGAQ